MAGVVEYIDVEGNLAVGRKSALAYLSIFRL
jgi:hypothetical protein